MNSLKNLCFKSLLVSLFFLVCTLNINAQENVAYNKKATQSSNYSPNAGQASKAVDGITHGNWSKGSVTHTKGKGSNNPWWQVDLGQNYDIEYMLIFNRTDACCLNRLDKFKILTKVDGGQWQEHIGLQRYKTGETYPLRFKKSVKARFVKIQLENPNGILSLAEVQVFEKRKNVFPPAAQQSSNNAIDVNQSIDPANWMKQLNPIIGNWKLSQIAAPGTHDSNMYKGTPNDWARNQTHNLVDQLNKGARIFDFRIGYIYTGCQEYSGAFLDPRLDNGSVGAQCWTCPSGYKRTVYGITSNKACEIPAKEDFKPAKNHGKGKGFLGTDCDGGQFWDPNGRCYSCPSGYNRTAHPVTSSKACSKLVKAQHAKATKKGDALAPNNPTNFVSKLAMPSVIEFFNDKVAKRKFLNDVPGKGKLIIMATGTRCGTPDWYLSGHDQMYIDVKVKDALSQMRKWLEAHPGETIVLRIEATDNRDAGKQQNYESLFRGALGNSKIFTEEPTEATLNQVKGKFILLTKRNTNAKHPNGTYYFKEYYNEVDEAGYFGGSGHAEPNQYKVAINEKVKELYSLSSQTPDKIRVLKSCLTPYGVGKEGAQDPKSLEKLWNPHFNDLIEGDWKGRDLNFIMMDFIGGNNNLAEKIIRLNFHKARAKN